MSLFQHSAKQHNVLPGSRVPDAPTLADVRRHPWLRRELFLGHDVIVGTFYFLASFNRYGASIPEAGKQPRRENSYEKYTTFRVSMLIAAR